MEKIHFERLITEVEKRTAIWDPRDQKHCNRDFVSKCWWDIGNALILEGLYKQNTNTHSVKILK